MTKTLIALGLALSIGIAPSFAQSEKTSGQSTETYGDNIIRFSPITALDIGVGPGISYERILSKDKKISLVFPLSVLLNNEYDYYGNGSTNYLTYLYFTPGIKFYPSGQKHINYAIGANLMMGYGGGTVYNNYDFPTPYFPTFYFPREETIFRLGVLVNNYVNFQVSPRFNLGLIGGLGVRYFDHRKIRSLDRSNPQTATYNEMMAITGEFSFTLGYRF